MKKIKILYYLFLLLIVTGCQFAEPVDYILRNREEGWYAIVYDCNNGVEKRYENDRLQMLFPENRILVTSYPAKFGIVDHRFFYYEEGKKKEFFPPSSNKSNPDFLVFGPTEVNNTAFNKTIFYFGKDNNAESEFDDFIYQVDEFINENKLNCGGENN